MILIILIKLLKNIMDGFLIIVLSIFAILDVSLFPINFVFNLIILIIGFVLTRYLGVLKNVLIFLIFLIFYI